MGDVSLLVAIALSPDNTRCFISAAAALVNVIASMCL